MDASLLQYSVHPDENEEVWNAFKSLTAQLAMARRRAKRFDTLRPYYNVLGGLVAQLGQVVRTPSVVLEFTAGGEIKDVETVRQAGAPGQSSRLTVVEGCGDILQQPLHPLYFCSR